MVLKHSQLARGVASWAPIAPVKVTFRPPPPLPADSELAMQLECCQTEVEFVRRRLKQTEEKLEAERQSREQLDTKVRWRWC